MVAVTSPGGYKHHINIEPTGTRANVRAILSEPALEPFADHLVSAELRHGAETLMHGLNSSELTDKMKWISTYADLAVSLHKDDEDRALLNNDSAEAIFDSMREDFGCASPDNYLDFVSAIESTRTDAFLPVADSVLDAYADAKASESVFNIDKDASTALMLVKFKANDRTSTYHDEFPELNFDDVNNRLSAEHSALSLSDANIAVERLSDSSLDKDVAERLAHNIVSDSVGLVSEKHRLDYEELDAPGSALPVHMYEASLDSLNRAHEVDDAETVLLARTMYDNGYALPENVSMLDIVKDVPQISKDEKPGITLRGAFVDDVQADNSAEMER